MRSLKLVCLILALSTTLFAADSPFTGSWKLDPSKGHLTPPIPKSVVVQVQADANTFKLNEEGIDNKDQPFKLGYEAKYDGKDYPVTGDPNSDAVSLQRVNEHHIKFTIKKAGKVVSKLDVVVAKDGKSSTVKSVDYIEGKTQKGTAIYDKQ
jgi:hypothetical protein